MMYIEVKTIKKFCQSLPKHAMQIINFKKKASLLGSYLKEFIKNEQKKSYQNANICYICKDKF